MKKAPSRAKQSRRQKADFLAMLIHDMRNLLSVILGHTEMLQEEAHGRSASREEEILEKLKANVLTLYSLMTNYMDLAPIESDPYGLQLIAVDLNEVVRGIMRRYEEEARRCRILLHLDIQVDPLVIRGDRLAVERVLSNLVSNALKFTPPEGFITMTTSRQGARAVVTVTDSGIGIAPQELPLLFQKYQRTSATQSHRGVGLGLFIAKTLTELHGGRIAAESSPGRGSRFMVEFLLMSPP